MTISATTQGLRMGVATSTSRPTVPFDGQVISETDTDSLKVYNGTAWIGVGGLTLINFTTVTAAATTTISNVFTSTYTDYRVVLTLRGVSNANKLMLQMCVSGTPVTSGYSAGCFLGQFSTGSPTNLNQGYAETANFVLGYVAGTGYATNLSFDLQNPQLALATGLTGLTQSVNSGSSDLGGVLAGFLNTSTAYDGMKILNNAGTAMTGTIAIYGYAKA